MQSALRPYGFYEPQVDSTVTDLGHNDWHVTVNINTGKPVLLSNPFVYAQLVAHGKWPNGQVEQMLKDGPADLVMVGGSDTIRLRWSPAALASLSTNYEVTRRFTCADAVFALEPKQH